MVNAARAFTQNKSDMETLSKEHVRQVVNTIWMQLVVTTAPDVIGSWGISRLSAKQIVRNINSYDFTMAALILNVDGFLFQGNVYVALDEGCDYYRIYFEKDGKLFWHWSPNHGFDMNFPIYGWNECLITYIMAASSPLFPISKDVYESCWKAGEGYRNTKEHYGITSPLGDWGESLCGPLFFEHYTFQGIDPNGLVDEEGVHYFEQGRAHTLLHRAYAIANPDNHKGYGANCWGFTAGDSNKGYVAHDPGTDLGVIQPTAALSSFPYTPEESLEVLKHLYYELGDTVWGEYGFVDGFNPETGWASNTWLAIDEGPIVNMIENYRTGMLWKLFMNIPDIQRGLTRLGFNSPYIK